jgi:hypothetical protein
MNNNDSENSWIITPSCWLSLATVPVILTLSLIESCNQSLIELGQVSEEVFRGSRLPLLHLEETNN